MRELPTVSILIPTLNEEATIGEVLACAAAQSYPSDLLEVVVVDGGSSDTTIEIIEAAVSENPSWRLIDNPEMHQSFGLNRAAEASHGEVLVRWDAHAAYPLDYVSTAVELLAQPGVDVVGGHWDPVGTDRFGRWSAAAMASRIGVGSTRYASVPGRRNVDTVSCGVMRRSTFDAVGGFDTSLRPAGEDADLMYRIRRSGGSIVLDPTIRVEYHPRSSAARLAQQYYGYGIAKALMFAKHGVFPSARPLAPAGLVAVMAATAMSRRLRVPGAVALAAYSAALVVGTGSPRNDSATDRLGSAAAAAIMHVAYGTGIWVGLAKTPFSRLRRTR